MTLTSKIADPTRLRSWLMWKKFFSTLKSPKFDFENGTAEQWKSLFGSICPACKGYRRAIREEDGLSYFCICSLLDWRETRNQIVAGIESPYRPAKVSELLPMGDEKSKSGLRNLKGAIGEWAKNPIQTDGTHKPWFFIYGGKGCGKTHILRGVKNYFGPLALYISTEDFQAQIHKCLDRNSSLSVQEYIRTLAGAPILLFDDLGAEYKKSEFFISSLYAVVNTRYNRGPNEWPMIVTSNIAIENLITSPDQDLQRIGSRLADREFVQVHYLPQSDYRLSGGA